MMTASKNELMSRLSEAIAGQMGLHFPPERQSDLERGLGTIAAQLGCSDAHSCARFLLRSFPLSKRLIDLLSGVLTIGETYFFRDKESFDVLSERVLPEITTRRDGTDRRLRIWSAGCCTGEEPYSIAILLDRIFPDLEQWKVTILGTDMNPFFLQKAAAGVYGEWSFRNAPPWLKSNYFRQVDTHHYEILPRIKQRVTFAVLNLAEDLYPSLTTNTNAMDLIFCRNVLLYFRKEGIKKVARNFHRCLTDKGLLFVSPTETSTENFPEFSMIESSGTLFYQKSVDPSFSSPATTHTVSLELTAHEEGQMLVEEGPHVKSAENLDRETVPMEIPSDQAALLARNCANLGELTEAQSWVEKALQGNKLNAGLHYLHAMILQEQGVSGESIASLKRALYLDPQFVLAHFALGNAAMQQKKLIEANRHFTNVLSLLAPYDPNDTLPQSDGLVAGRLKEMVESAMMMERAS